MTILIVDDHPIVRKGIHALLASAFADAEVIDASCLKEAEEACSTRDVNIMITDLDLNGESGLTLIKRVRDIPPAFKSSSTPCTRSRGRCARWPTSTPRGW